MELFDALLDIVDAVSGAVALAVIWVTWVMPRRHRRSEAPRDSPGESAEIERFLHEAASSGSERERAPDPTVRV